MQHAPETTKHVVDGISLLTVFGTLVELLPSIAALISIIWGCIRIYETQTIQRLLGRQAQGDENDAAR